MTDTDLSTSHLAPVPRDITLLHMLKGHTDSVHSVAWSPDGTRLASGSIDGTVRMWEGSSGKLLYTLGGDLCSVNTVTWSPDGTQLASCSTDGPMCLWDGSSGKLLHMLKGEGHQDYLDSVVWSPDGKRLASSGAADNTVCLWDGRTGKLLQVLDRNVGIAWSPDGARLASISSNGVSLISRSEVSLWDGRTGKLLQVLIKRTNAWSLYWSPDGKQLALGFQNKTVQLWEVSSGKHLHTLKGHTETTHSVAWSPDGTQLASGSGDKTVRLWDRSSGKLLHILKGHTNNICSVAWSPDGKRLASSSCSLDFNTTAATEVCIWHTSTWELLETLPGQPRFALFAWHPGLPLLVTLGQQKGAIYLWQLNMNTLLDSTDHSPYI